ncbi:MAG: twin-arginine translocation pathway signal protein [Nitrospira sp.]|nr:MAG: twin-arginine translocation pathway signal protein [Nitrospira sp.]
MKHHDTQGGALLSRRQGLILLGATGVGWMLGDRLTTNSSVASPPQALCVLRPEQTEGPYFVDERLHRMDIRSDPTDGRVTPGTQLALTFHISRVRAGECHPLPNAQVDVWHCDAMGVYSDVRDPGFSTVGRKFLRGYQMTDTQGTARFLTIYPGWYPIRTVHIHFKIRTAPSAEKRYEFTSQLYFPDELTDHVHTALPYTSQGRRRVRNQQDFIFRDGGDQLLCQPSPTTGGYTATFPIGLELS